MSSIVPTPHQQARLGTTVVAHLVSLLPLLHSPASKPPIGDCGARGLPAAMYLLIRSSRLLRSVAADYPMMP